MNLIDRYVYTVTERLPEKTREDVGMELRANIEDMLPENPTESDVRAALVKLGNPINLARDYSEVKGYLIGPGLYDSYITVLKLVISIFTAVIISITLISGVFTSSVTVGLVEMSIKMIIEMLTGILQGVMQSFLWVTFSFAVVERLGISEGEFSHNGLFTFKKKQWTPDDLPTSPVNNKRRISRGETIFSMICTVIFISLVVDGGLLLSKIASIFVVERLELYIIFIILLAMFEFSLLIWKFVSKQWTLPLAIANAVGNIAVSILLVIMVSDSSLFNQELLSGVALSGIEDTWVVSSIRISVMVFLLINIWDSINPFVKLKK